MEADDQRTLSFLEEQFQVAVARRDAASAHFDAIAHAIPSGLSAPDGAQRIKNASDAYAAALMAVTRAVKRMADFQVRHIVPDDLRRDHISGRRKSLLGKA